jgi:hypothetical protein
MTDAQLNALILRELRQTKPALAARRRKIATLLHAMRELAREVTPGLFFCPWNRFSHRAPKTLQ